MVPETIDLDALKTTGNVSLRPPQAKVLRTLNQRLQGISPVDHLPFGGQALSLGSCRQNPCLSNATYSLTNEQRAQARQWSLELSTSLRDQGYTIVGDLDELDAPTSADPRIVRPTI